MNPDQEIITKQELRVLMYSLGFITLGALASFISLTLTQENATSKSISNSTLEQMTETVITPQAMNPFDNIYVRGKAAYVWDIHNQKVLFEKNPEAQLPLASLTKLMTTYIAAKTLEPDEIITVDANSLETEGDSGLLVNESWRFNDLAEFTLVVSSNDGANMLASIASTAIGSSTADFVEIMNTTAQEIDLPQTYFLNETGLDPTTSTSGGYGSAKDVAILMERILRDFPELLRSTAYETQEFVSLDGFIHSATNTNEHVSSIPGLIASKTGYTDLAGGNLGIIFDAGLQYPLAVIVLGSTIEGRFTDVERLVNASLAYIKEF